MADIEQEKLTYHLAELRKTILSVIICLIILFPLGYFLAPYCIDWLVNRSSFNQHFTLNFFSPMEVFLVNLKSLKHK